MSISQESDDELLVIYETIRSGAKDFLWAEYQVILNLNITLFFVSLPHTFLYRK